MLSSQLKRLGTKKGYVKIVIKDRIYSFAIWISLVVRYFYCAIVKFREGEGISSY